MYSNNRFGTDGSNWCGSPRQFLKTPLWLNPVWRSGRDVHTDCNAIGLFHWYFKIYSNWCYQIICLSKWYSMLYVIGIILSDTSIAYWPRCLKAARFARVFAKHQPRFFGKYCHNHKEEIVTAMPRYRDPSSLIKMKQSLWCIISKQLFIDRTELRFDIIKICQFITTMTTYPY